MKSVYLSKLSDFKILFIMVNISRVGLKKEWPDKYRY